MFRIHAARPNFQQPASASKTRVNAEERALWVGRGVDAVALEPGPVALVGNRVHGQIRTTALWIVAFARGGSGAMTARQGGSGNGCRCRTGKPARTRIRCRSQPAPAGRGARKMCSPERRRGEEAKCGSEEQNAHGEAPQNAPTRAVRRALSNIVASQKLSRTPSPPFNRHSRENRPRWALTPPARRRLLQT